MWPFYFILMWAGIRLLGRCATCVRYSPCTLPILKGRQVLTYHVYTYYLINIYTYTTQTCVQLRIGSSIPTGMIHASAQCMGVFIIHGFKPIEPNIKAPNCFFTIVDASALYWITSGIPTVSTQGRTGTSFTIIFVPHSHSYNRITRFTRTRSLRVQSNTSNDRSLKNRLKKFELLLRVYPLPV